MFSTLVSLEDILRLKLKVKTNISFCNAGPPMAIPIYRVLPYCVIIMQLTATKSIHIIIQELMNLLHRNKFSPWEDFFFNPFGSDVISSNKLCKCTCMYISTCAGQSICSGKMKRLKYNCSFTSPSIL